MFFGILDIFTFPLTFCWYYISTHFLSKKPKIDINIPGNFNVNLPNMNLNAPNLNMPGMPGFSLNNYENTDIGYIPWSLRGRINHNDDWIIYKIEI